MFMNWNEGLGKAVSNVPTFQGGNMVADGASLLQTLPKTGERGERFGERGCNLSRLRTCLMEGYDVRRCTFVLPQTEGRSYSGLRDYLQRSHWQMVTVGSARHDLHRHAGYDYILHMMKELAGSDRRGTFALVSHNNLFRDGLLELQQDYGWRTIVIGDCGRMGRQLLKLENHGVIVFDFAEIDQLPVSPVFTLDRASLRSDIDGSSLSLGV